MPDLRSPNPEANDPPMLKYDQPDARGHFGPYGGTFVAETLIHALDELRAAYASYRDDPEFVAEYRAELAHFVGRPSPVYHAARTSRELGGAQIHLKREDLNHTGDCQWYLKDIFLRKVIWCS